MHVVRRNWCCSFYTFSYETVVWLPSLPCATALKLTSEGLETFSSCLLYTCETEHCDNAITKNTKTVWIETEQMFYPGRARPVFTCMFQHYLAFTVLLVSKPFGGRWRRQCQFGGDTSSSRVWRQVPESEVRQVVFPQHFYLCRFPLLCSLSLLGQSFSSRAVVEDSYILPGAQRPDGGTEAGTCIVVFKGPRVQREGAGNEMSRKSATYLCGT